MFISEVSKAVKLIAAPSSGLHAIAATPSNRTKDSQSPRRVLFRALCRLHANYIRINIYMYLHILSINGRSVGIRVLKFFIQLLKRCPHVTISQRFRLQIGHSDRKILIASLMKNTMMNIWPFSCRRTHMPVTSKAYKIYML